MKEPSRYRQHLRLSAFPSPNKDTPSSSPSARRQPIRVPRPARLRAPLCTRSSNTRLRGGRPKAEKRRYFILAHAATSLTSRHISVGPSARKSLWLSKLGGRVGKRFDGGCLATTPIHVDSSAAGCSAAVHRCALGRLLSEGGRPLIPRPRRSPPTALHVNRRVRPTSNPSIQRGIGDCWRRYTGASTLETERRKNLTTC